MKTQHWFSCGADIGVYEPLPSYLPEVCQSAECADAMALEIAQLAEYQRLRDDDYASRKGQQWAGEPADGDETKQMIQRLRDRLIEMPDPDGGMSAAYQSLYLIAVEAVDGCEALECECDEYDAQTVRTEKNLRDAAVEIERLRSAEYAQAEMLREVRRLQAALQWARNSMAKLMDCEANESDCAACLKEADHLLPPNAALNRQAAAATVTPGPHAPANSLPDWSECELRVANSEFIAKRVAEGGYGAEPDSLLATELHRFIYEYDDADRFRSAWFLHRLELVLHEAKADGAR